MATDKNIPKGAKFLLGGAAGMSGAAVVHPLDLVKNRMQLSGSDGVKKYSSTFHAFSSIVEHEGIFALYKGLGASLLRQATYTTTRLGVYTWSLEAFAKKDQPLSFTRKILLGMMAGACGAAVGSPADLVLIRMTGDGHLPPDHRRNYKNVIDALIRIIKEEGPLALYRGCAPTVARSVVSNGAQLATYTQGKQMILTAGILSDGIFCHFVASSISGLVTTVVALPVDTIKTRIQAMKIIKGKPEHSGILDVCVKIIQNEGFFSFWKGFTPFFMRQAPHTVLMLVFLEQFNRAYLRIFSSHATT